MTSACSVRRVEVELIALASHKLPLFVWPPSQRALIDRLLIRCGDAFVRSVLRFSTEASLVFSKHSLAIAQSDLGHFA